MAGRRDRAQRHGARRVIAFGLILIVVTALVPRLAPVAALAFAVASFAYLNRHRAGGDT
jgi:hypothetical protein